MVVVMDAVRADALRCHLSAQPAYGVFALAFAPWPTTTVLKCPLAALPAQDRLSVRDVRVIYAHRAARCAISYQHSTSVNPSAERRPHSGA